MPREMLSPALLASQRSLIDSMPFPVFIRGRDGRYLACNRLFQDFIGRSEGQVVGMTAADLTAPAAAEVYDRQNAEVWAERRPLSHDARVRRADGSQRQVRIHRSILYADNGEAVGIIGILQDVTEERQAVTALAESEARFARLAELTSEGVMLHAHGEVVDVNEALTRMTGRSRDQLVGQHYSVLIGSDDQARARSHVDAHSTAPYRIDLLRADGTSFPAEIRGHDITYQDREIRVTTITDITERLAAEQATRERELLYRQMFENNSAVKLLIDPANGQIVDANAAAARFYGWSIDRLRLMNITHINALPPDQVRAEMAKAQREERNFFRFRHRTADDSIHPVEVFSGPCTFHGRALLHSIVIDVTERERVPVEL